MGKETVRKTRSGKMIFFLMFAAGILMLSLYLVKTERTSLTGTRYVDEEDALEMLLPESERRLSAVLYSMFFGPKKNLLFDSIRIRPDGLHSVRITVSETPADCAVHTELGYAAVNRNGMAAAFYESCPEELTVLMGFDAKAAARYEAVSVSDEERFQEALSLAKSVRTSGIPCEMIVCGSGAFKILTGKLTVDFGSSEYAEQKLTAFLDMYPSLLGLRGTLHLENYDPETDDGKYYFEVGQ